MAKNAVVKNFMADRARPHPEQPAIIEHQETVRALMHELQNHLHCAAMEIELARVGVAHSVDTDKLSRVLDSLKNSLQALRVYVLPTQDLTREDPLTILHSVLVEVDKKFSARKIRLHLHQREPTPAVELNKECTRHAFEKVLIYCYRNLRGRGDLQITTGAKLLDGRNFAEIVFTLLRPSSEDYIDDDNDDGSVIFDAIDMDMFLASEILKRYGSAISLARDNKKQVCLTVMMPSARQ